MQILDTKYKRKSAGITTVILLLLLFALFNYGMRYYDPPIEYGVAINFGDSNIGSGDPVENTLAPPKNEEVDPVIEQTQQEKQEQASQEVVEENIVTEETQKDVPVVRKTETPKKNEPKKEVVKKKKEVSKTKTNPKKEKPKKSKPKPSKATTDALNSLLSGNSSKGGVKGEGGDSESGVKGSRDGDPNSSKYYGTGGIGSGGNYRLAGRKALLKPKKKPDCEQEGKVYVTVYVDKSGKVTKAIPGVRGTTNSASCLLNAAKKAALKTKWNPDVNAPSTQKGVIIYRFSLSQ